MKKGILFTGLLITLLVLAYAAPPAVAFPRNKPKKIKVNADTTSTNTGRPKYPTIYGFRIGACMATIHGDVKDRYPVPHLKTALTLGAFARIGLSDHLIFQPEFFYVIKGAQTSDGIEKYKLSYLELSVLAGYKLSMHGKIRPIIYLGPAADFLTNAQMAYPNSSYDVSDNTSKYDVGLTVGGSLEFPVGRGHYILDARYTFGLQTVDNTEDNLSIFNRALSVTVGYGFK